MKKANTIEDEINRIRLKIYKRTKDMTPAQRTEYYRKSGEASAKKYGFTICAGVEEVRGGGVGQLVANVKS